MRGKLDSALALALLPAVATATTGAGTIALRAEVPVVCKLKYEGDVSQQADGYRLGLLREYCNAPRGFTVSVDYSPGALRNAALRIGGQQIVLDGSGHAQVYHADGPRSRSLEVSATPGSAGFDADRLDFRIEPD